MNHKHGHAAGHGSPTYRSWEMMRVRCRADFAQAADYAGRGITVCERWLAFENFLADMGERPPNTTLERRDNDRGYEPENCCWATRQAQSRNRRGRTHVRFQGAQMILAEAVERSGVPKQLFEQRVYSRGWSVERALTTPARRYRRA